MYGKSINRSKFVVRIYKLNIVFDWKRNPVAPHNDFTRIIIDFIIII